MGSGRLRHGRWKTGRCSPLPPGAGSGRGKAPTGEIGRPPRALGRRSWDRAPDADSTARARLRILYPLRRLKHRIDLEERLAFQERALEQLNRVVAEQQLELDGVQRELIELRRASRATEGGKDGETRSLEDDRPPHY